MRQAFQVPRWTSATRIAFRFCFAYFGLYCLATQIAGGLLLVPNFYVPALGVLWPMRQITFWFAEYVFGVTSALAYTGNSGDTLFFWVQTFWLLLVALIATAVWSALDRRRENYLTLHKWFRLFIRFGLAAQMLYYGMAKVIPTQFPAPSLITLVQPSGSLSLTGTLWTSIGASPAYQMFTGWAEVLAGVLLVVPRTAISGAMICLADMIQVFVLNMTYDIGLKLISFHLIVMTVFLLAPEFLRLATFFFSDHATGPSTQPELFRTRRANRAALVVQIVFGIYLWGMFTAIHRSRWYADGGGRPRSALYGIWNVDQLSIDGELRAPALNDYDRRWRRVIFDSPRSMAFQRTDDSFARYGVSIDVDNKTLALTKGDSRSWSASFSFQRPVLDRLILDGEMDSHKIRMQLERIDFDTFRLLNSSFRWVRPPDVIQP